MVGLGVAGVFAAVFGIGHRCDDPGDCTHYPIFTRVIQETLGEEVRLIEFADAAYGRWPCARQLDTMHNRSGQYPPGPAELLCHGSGSAFQAAAGGTFLGESVGLPVWVTPEMLELAEAS